VAFRRSLPFPRPIRDRRLSPVRPPIRPASGATDPLDRSNPRADGGSKPKPNPGSSLFAKLVTTPPPCAINNIPRKQVGKFGGPCYPSSEGRFWPARPDERKNVRRTAQNCSPPPDSSTRRVKAQSAGQPMPAQPPRRTNGSTAFVGCRPWSPGSKALCSLMTLISLNIAIYRRYFRY
jgi:hypothetical protein